MRRLLFFFLFSICVLPLTITPAHAAITFLDDEAEPACDVSFSLQKGGAGEFSLFFDHKDLKNGYVLEATGAIARFSIWQNGVKRPLSSAPVAWKASQSVILQRRPWLMRLIVEDRVVLSAYDATYSTGKIGAQGAGWSWKDARLQPVEPIRFDDDFTRTGGAGDADWTVGQGRWTLSAASENISVRNASMSSNPFAFEVAAPKEDAFSTTGRKFWSDYEARVAARPQGRGTIGIAGYVQDPKNYLAFLWDGREGTGARRLVRVRDGVSTTLTQASGAFLPRQWVEIGIRLAPGAVEALVDGVSVLRARDDSFGRGGIGLLARRLDLAAFDDVRVRSYDFYRGEMGAQNGAWTSNGALRLLGRSELNSYELQTTARGAAKGALGLVAGFVDAKNYSLFRAASATSDASFHGRQQIVRFSDGTAKILSDAPLTFDLASNPHLTLSAQNGAIRVLRGEELIAQAAQPGLTAGLAGVWNPQFFAPEAVLYFPPAPDAPKIADRMEGDSYMAGWASSTGQWPPVAGPGGLEFWNSSEFFGDASLEFPWRASSQGALEVALRARRGEFKSGLVLRGEASADRKTIAWSLSRGDKTLRSAVVPIPAATIEDDAAHPLLFKVALQGQGVLLFAGEVPVLSLFEASAPADEAALQGHAMGVRAQGFRIRAERLNAVSSNRDDTTFSGAPIDFYAPQGQWSIFSRWPCYGDWSFFGGSGLNPVLWSKRSYGGDIVAQIYAHPQMALPKEPGYAHPGDLNVTLCGDGKDLASGYSFVIAGWDNTRTKLLRGSQVLAENRGQEAFFREAINHNTQWHRKWFAIRAAATRAVKDGKNGVELTLFIDERPILTAFDPNPLPTWKSGGRVAFWTLDSTLMVARAKIEAQILGAKATPAGLFDSTPMVEVATAPTNAPNDDLQPQSTVVDDAATAIVTRDESGWNVQNPASGGHFEVDLARAPLDATPQSRFSFEAQIPAGVKIDAYCVIEGNRYLIEMSGQQRPDASAPALGAFSRGAVKADGTATYSFALGEALAKRFPDQKSWKIESLSLGARHGDAYRWLGFDGNALGSQYHLANLRWQ